MLLKLFLLFTILPALEMILLLKVGSIVGFPGTVAIILLTGALGASLARQQGIQTIANIKSSMNQGKVPTSSLVDGFLILIAGIVLITPGLITDTIGFILLIPPCRALLRAYAIEAFKHNVKIVTPFQQPQQGAQHSKPHNPTAVDDEIIDIKATTVDDDKK